MLSAWGPGVRHLKGVLIFEEEAIFLCKSSWKFVLLISGQDADIRALLQMGRDKLLLGRRRPGKAADSLGESNSGCCQARELFRA